MNLEMIHDFGQNYPEYLEGTLDYIGVSTICQFNRRGTLLAVGCNDGKVLIWDFLTREVSKCLTCHIWPVCCISWSRDSNCVLTTCADNTVCIWNVLNGDCIQQYSSKILVVPVKQIPILICRDRNEEIQLLNANENLQETNLIAGFDHRGQYLFVVVAGGKLFVIDVSTAKVKNCVSVAGVAANCTAKQIEYARRGSSILISGSDRVIRIVNMSDLLNATGDMSIVNPQQRLQDLVNKTQWRKCCFSGDGEYVCASTTKQHNIYIWEKESGSLVQILSGAKGETIVDIAWHPIHPIITTVANGVVSIWSQDRVENWSGLVPNFRELDENVEYEERESEFDDYDEDKTASAKKSSTEDDDVSIDVCGINPIPAFLSSDEEFEDPNELVYISTVPEIDDPEDSNEGSVDSFNDCTGETRHNGQTPLGLARPYKRTANEVAKNAPSQPPAPAISKDVIPATTPPRDDSRSRSSVDLVRGDEEEMAGTRKRAANTSISRCKTRSTGSISSATSTATVMTSDGAEYSSSNAEKSTMTLRKHKK